VSLKGKFSFKREWAAGVLDFRKVSSALLTTHLSLLVFKNLLILLKTLLIINSPCILDLNYGNISVHF